MPTFFGITRNYKKFVDFRLGLPPTHLAQEVPNGPETAESYVNNYFTKHSKSLSPYAMRFWEAMDAEHNGIDGAAPH